MINLAGVRIRLSDIEQYWGEGYDSTSYRFSYCIKLKKIGSDAVHVYEYMYDSIRDKDLARLDALLLRKDPS